MAAPDPRDRPRLPVGVLGGMGPEATLAFCARLLAQTPATCDQDHLHVIVNSNPRIPDRTTALLGRGPSPVPMMAEGIAALERAGAAFVVIPCVSAHAFLDELREHAPVPIVSIFEAIVAACPAGTQRVGLLATDGTVRTGHLERHLRQAGLAVLVPGEDDQSAVQTAIYAVKSGATPERREQFAGTLRDVARRLVERGADAIVLGCTEIPLVFAVASSPAPVVDALTALAAAAVRHATSGRVPGHADAAARQGETA